MTRSRSFAPEPGAPRAARRFAIEALAGLSAETLEAVELMVSELATNCVRHVGSGFRITIHEGSGEIRVAVTDGGRGRPAMCSPRPEDEHGRGLRIVDMLARRWGVDYEDPAGKTVWFTLDGEPASS